MTDPGKPKASLSKRILLVASLGLNLLIIGLVAGALLRGGPPDHRRPVDRSFGIVGLRSYMRGLDDQDRQALRVAIDENRDQIQAGRSVIRQHLEELAEALRAEPFDTKAVEQVLAAQRQAVTGNIKLGHSILMTRINLMTAAERQSFAERLENSRGPKGKQP